MWLGRWWGKDRRVGVDLTQHQFAIWVRSIDGFFAGTYTLSVACLLCRLPFSTQDVLACFRLPAAFAC